MKLALTNFIGEIPRIAPRILPDNAAQIAEEVKINSGELRPLYEDIEVMSLDDDIVAVYKWYVSSDKYAWILSDRPFSIEKSPAFNDEYARIIINYKDTKETRITDSATVQLEPGSGQEYAPVRLTNNNTYSLAVPGVISPGTMAVSGTSTGNVESRSYAVALVREWSDGKLDVGPLSSPAKTSQGLYTVDVGLGQTVTLSGINIPSTAYSDAGVREIYVYRSVTTSDGSAAYSYVGSIPVVSGTVTYSFTDDVPAVDVAETAVSSEWDTPPSLSGILALGNGVLVGYSGYDIYFSYPYQAHAWPNAYRVSVDYEIVGLGSFGNTVVVCTKGSPYLVLVQDPAAATVRAINGSYPCLSEASILSLSTGVYYAAPGGLLLVNSTSPSYYTSALVTKDEWARFNPENLKSAFYQYNYVGVSSSEDTYSGFLLNITDASPGIIELKRNATFVYSDIQDNSLYFILKDSTGSRLIKYDSPSYSSEEKFKFFKWKSRVFTSTEGVHTMSAVRVRAEYGIDNYVSPFVYSAYLNPFNSVSLNTGSVNAPVNMSELYKEFIKNKAVLFTYYVDGVPKFSKLIYSNAPVRLPAGFRGHEVELEVVASTPVHSIEVASSIGELL